MAWQSYELDRIAQKLVLDAKGRDLEAKGRNSEAKGRDRDSLNQSYKMRMAVAYGLERFWGEHLRLQKREPTKAQYWKETWDEWVTVMNKAGVTIPNDAVKPDDVPAIRAMSEKLWRLTLDEQRIAMAVLTQLCECLVWWTQRYK